MRYEGNVFRPPSEARSLIIQCTIGCSHNQCTFCYMYRDDVFRIRKLEEIIADIQECGERYPFVEKLFLADGDALVMKTSDLQAIMQEAKKQFKKLRQITCYATVRDILNKSLEELELLRNEGLSMCYIGLESGADSILREVHKNNTADEFVRAVNKLHEVGIKSSVTIISGLGQRAKSREHAIETAKVISACRPEYAAFLNLRIKEGTPLETQVLSGGYELLGDEELLEEMKLFLQNVDSPGTVFRSNHASNPLAIAGTLNKDRDKMIQEIDEAIRNQDFIPKFWREL